MLLTRGTPDYIAGSNYLFRTTLALHPPTSKGDDECLPERMLVPGCSSAGLERNTHAEHARRIGRLEQGVNAYGTGKIISRSFAGGL
jgi:hypothetical protein